MYYYDFTMNIKAWGPIDFFTFGKIAVSIDSLGFGMKTVAPFLDLITLVREPWMKPRKIL